jgi:hypothetical protein
MKMEVRSRAIDKVYKRRDRIDMPDFQREEVWPDSKKRTLIDSVLRGWHLPKFYLRVLEDGSYECVDGQQRLAAIFEFFDDNLELDADAARRLRARKYSELEPAASDAFDDFEIDIEEIEEATDADLEELFRRLQLGEPLNTAEKINAIKGEMRDFCHETADRPFFGRTGVKDTRYAHFETAAKWVFVEARGIQPQLRHPQLESLLTENRTFSRASDTAKRITGAITFLELAFPDRCPVVRNRANLLSVCMLAARVSAQGLASAAAASEFQDFVVSFFTQLSAEVEKGARATDKELLRYQQAITSGSTGGDSITSRINILTKRLGAFSPMFSKLLGSYPGAADEAAKNVSELALSARDLVYQLNRSYAAREGCDLFKMTNESAEAMATISHPVRDVSQYGCFIDGLYFLVYEGSGSCKRLGDFPPDFAMDIKFLRSAVRHDPDHGSASEVTARRKRAGQVLEKYAGKKTPEECGPEDLLAAQIRILQSLVDFLAGLQV